MTTRRAPLAKPKKKVAYHHADLRRALLDAALVHLRTGDITSLNLQVLARTVGVSRGAPYHHFADKVALLAALAEEGFSLWLEDLERIDPTRQEPTKALATLARAWLDFARKHPEHYRVMFLRDIEDRVRFASLHDTSGRALEYLVQLLARMQPDASIPELLARAVSVWSTVHGFACLRDAGVLTNIPGLPPLAELESRLVGDVAATGPTGARAGRGSNRR